MCIFVTHIKDFDESVFCKTYITLYFEIKSTYLNWKYNRVPIIWVSCNPVSALVELLKKYDLFSDFGTDIAVESFRFSQDIVW